MPLKWSWKLQYNAACTGTLKSLVREGGNSSPMSGGHAEELLSC